MAQSHLKESSYALPARGLAPRGQRRCHHRRRRPSQGPGIKGIIVERRAWHADQRGALEVVDLSRPFWSGPVVYSCCFTIRPGRIRSWGMHGLQAAQHKRGQLRPECDLVAARLDQVELRLRLQ